MEYAQLENPHPLPPMDVNPDEVDAILVQELNQMTLKERELVYEEVHGVDAIIDESQEFVYERLEALDRELHQIPSKPAYEKAKKISKEYVTDRNFRLMFLRANYFDFEKAAVCLVKFMEVKLKYFGPEALARPLYLSDLDKDDKQVLKSGLIQFLPARDRNGRAIFGDFGLINTKCYKRPENVFKAFIYLMMAVIEDEDTQKRGIVALMYFIGSTSISGIASDLDMSKQGTTLFECLPIRFTSVHICFDDVRFRVMNALLMLIMGRDRRVRLRTHDATHTECQYNLMTFGIPVECLPLTDEGALKAANQMKWIAKRKIKESKLKRSEEFHGIDLPGTNDILVGRGKPIGGHLGNVQLRRLVDHYLDEYEHATKQEKTLIATRIVNETKKYPTRFLKRNPDGWWVEVPDEVARTKVSTCFRSARSSKMAMQSQLPQFAESGDSKRLRIHARSQPSCFPIHGCPDS